MAEAADSGLDNLPRQVGDRGQPTAGPQRRQVLRQQPTPIAVGADTRSDFTFNTPEGIKSTTVEEFLKMLK